MPKKRETYDERARQFAQAVDVVIGVVMGSPSYSDTDKATLTQGFAELRHMALEPQPQFRRVASLRYLEEALLSGWNDANGPEADHIWSEIRKLGLPYTRKDVLSTILKRKRIKDQHEFDYVTDSIVIAQQEGRITEEQAIALDRMLMDFQG